MELYKFVAVALLGVLATVTSVVEAIKDGYTVDPCRFPGLAAVVVPDNNAIICNAAIIASDLLVVPEICGSAMISFLQSNNLLLKYGDGSQSSILPKNLPGAVNNGVYTFNLPSPLTGTCSSYAHMYTSDMTLEPSSCEVVGYGADTKSSKTFDGIPRAATITKSTSSPCCHVILPSLSQSQKGIIINSDASFNCLMSSGATCGSGDIGAPVYCNTTTQATVLTGLTSSSPCVSGDMFLVHDLTQDASNFKFGFY